MRRDVVRAFAAAVATGACLFMMAAPAQAHPLSYGDDASNWVSTVTAITPSGAVVARSTDGVQRLTVTLRSAHQVVVQGYHGEPFVLLRAHGAWVNTRSTTWYAVQGPKVAVPSTVDDAADPAWHRVSGTGSWSWHDQRTHWPGFALPAPVQLQPDARQHVLDWRVPLVADGSRGSITGTLDWVPGPTGGTGAAVATAAFAGLVALCVLARRASVRVAALAGSLVALVVLDAAHSAGMVAGRVGDIGSRLAALPGHGGLPVLLWVGGLVTVVYLWRGHETALYAAAMLGAVFCFTEALPSLAVLWRSHAVNALPMPANRVLVALLMGLSLATLVGAVTLISRSIRLGNSSTPAVDS